MGDDHETCADCGTIDREVVFHACVAADFTAPDYGVVHHLAVSAYGLQHGWYPAEAEPRVVDVLISHADRPPSDHDRRSIRSAADGPVQVLARQPRSRNIDWQHDVGDVDRSSAGCGGTHDASPDTEITEGPRLLVDMVARVGRPGKHQEAGTVQRFDAPR